MIDILKDDLYICVHNTQFKFQTYSTIKH